MNVATVALHEAVESALQRDLRVLSLHHGVGEADGAGGRREEEKK